MPGSLPQMLVAILCGGRGTRLQEHSPEVPKPLVEIGGRPILWHVIQIYAAQGHRRFLLLTGYRGEQIEAFARETYWPEGVEVTLRWTPAPDTPTGGRLWHAREELAGGPFLATYADGVADIDLAALRARHEAAGTLAAVTVVRPQLPFGVALLDGEDRVAGFHEKPQRRALGQRRLLLAAAGRARLPVRGRRARARAARAPGGRRRARRLPPRGLLGLHGHLQGRGRAQRPVGRRRRALGRGPARCPS